MLGGMAAARVTIGARWAIVALAACRGTPAPASDPPRAAPPPCADRLRAEHAIDVSPEPRVCDELAAAIAPLSAAAKAQVRDLVIVRGARGPCGDACPDLATALMSDGALAFYRSGRHELHLVDAYFDGPRWRGGTPAPEAVDAYLAQLGLASWDALVARVRALPGADLPADVPRGAPRVFEEIVRLGPAALLGGEVARVDLLRHELGHAVLLRNDLGRAVEAWGTLSGWVEGAGEPADGYIAGFYANERPIVASRLLLGLPRGADTHYTPRRPGTPTRYAAFDPMEDHAESFRLVHADPEALGAASPARLLALAPGVVDLRAPRLRRFVRPGAAALLAPDVDPALAMATLRAHAGALLPEAAALADPRPLPIPPSTHPDVRAAVDALRLVVEVGGLRFRPPDAAIAKLLARLERERADLEELARAIEGLSAPR